jgi:beta-lactamase class D
MNDVVTGGTGRAAKYRVCRFWENRYGAKSHGEAHAWFIGYMKEPNQTVAFAVLIEHGKSGAELQRKSLARCLNLYHQQTIAQTLANASINY